MKLQFEQVVDLQQMLEKSRLSPEQEVESVVLQRLHLDAKALVWSSLTFQNKAVEIRLV
jgi:hypothetical protein